MIVWPSYMIHDLTTRIERKLHLNGLSFLNKTEKLSLSSCFTPLLSTILFSSPNPDLCFMRDDLLSVHLEKVTIAWKNNNKTIRKENYGQRSACLWLQHMTVNIQHTQGDRLHCLAGFCKGSSYAAFCWDVFGQQHHIHMSLRKAIPDRFHKLSSGCWIM